MLLPHYLLAFSLTVGAASTAVAAPLQSAEPVSNSRSILARTVTSTDNRASECFQDPDAVSIQDDGLREVTSLPPCYTPSIDAGRVPSPPPIVLPLIEARTYKPGLTHSTGPLVGKDGNALTAQTILSGLGKNPSPQAVHDALESESDSWKRDIAKSETLAAFKKTANGKLYMDTEKLIGKLYPGFDQVELESNILKDLFISSMLHPLPKLYWIITKNGYVTLTELRTYTKDTRGSRNWNEFQTTPSGRLLQSLHKAISSLKPDFRIDYLQRFVQQDIDGLTTEAKASKLMHELLGDDQWDAERKVCNIKTKSVLAKKRVRYRWLLRSSPPSVAKELKKMLDGAFAACHQTQTPNRNDGPLQKPQPSPNDGPLQIPQPSPNDGPLPKPQPSPNDGPLRKPQPAPNGIGSSGRASPNTNTRAASW
ncbi:hypothetical protein C8R42DRAFT_719797 [Lentinula raphanica]|nr:hypothetical protein C8R42DRAFT_719797 [Lentinula raphanica]